MGMYDYPFPKDEPEGDEREEDITGLFETSNPRLKAKMAQLAYAYEHAVLEEDEELMAEIIQEANEARGISQ